MITIRQASVLTGLSQLQIWMLVINNKVDHNKEMVNRDSLLEWIDQNQDLYKIIIQPKQQECSAFAEYLNLQNYEKLTNQRG